MFFQEHPINESKDINDRVQFLKRKIDDLATSGGAGHQGSLLQPGRIIFCVDDGSMRKIGGLINQRSIFKMNLKIHQFQSIGHVF